MPPTYSATTQPTAKTLCCYTNPTRKIQLIKVTNGKHQSLEKIIFPQQKILFEAIPEEQLAVYSEQQGEQMLVEIVSCQNLPTTKI